MNNPALKMAAEVIDDEITAVLLPLSRHLTPADPRVLDWMDRLEKAMPASRSRAFLTMANVMHITGDSDAMNRFLERAANSGASSHEVANYRCSMDQNLGYFTTALRNASSVFSIRALNINIGLALIVGCGGFHFAAKLLEQARLAKVDMDHAPQIDDIRSIAAFASRTDVSDEQFAAVLDIAGALLRERHLLWMDQAPQFSFDEEMDCPGVRFRVDVSAEQAADMTFEFIERLVQADLDQVPLTVGFIGVYAEELEAVSA